MPSGPLPPPRARADIRAIRLEIYHFPRYQLWLARLFFAPQPLFFAGAQLFVGGAERGGCRLVGLQPREVQVHTQLLQLPISFGEFGLELFLSILGGVL